MPDDVFLAAKRVGIEVVLEGAGIRLNRSKQGPCPICGGVDRFYLHKSGFAGCRKCQFKGDVIDLMAAIKGLSKLEAARQLAGVAQRDWQKRAGKPEPARRAANIQPESQAKRLPEDAHARVEEAQAGLKGSEAERYLTVRGIRLATAIAWGLGFRGELFDPRTHEKRPALVIPWFDESGGLIAVKYRFIDTLASRDPARRYTAMRSSNPSVYGLKRLEACPRLIVVEGELNAISISQALEPQSGASVVSSGSQSGLASDRLVEVARRYSTTLIWGDDINHVRQAQARIPGAKGLHHPIFDANRLLADKGDDYLRSFLGRVFGDEVYDPFLECENLRPK